MTRIKICGLTRKQDALLAAELGADAVGFVFAPGSKRKADPEEAAEIIAELPPFVTTVGVFQNQPIEEVRKIARDCSLAAIQLHGNEDFYYIRDLGNLGLKAYKAFALSCREDLSKIKHFSDPPPRAFLLDACSGAQTGGTGKTFNWDWAVEAKQFGKVILAGGLSPDNVVQAIKTVRPWCVDTASGTEKAPGIKDPELLQIFMKAAKSIDAFD